MSANKWVLKNSFQKVIHEESLPLIEAWNDVVFYYSKMTNVNEIYEKNYFFFASSQNAPFSRNECLECLHFALSLFSSESFLSSMTVQDQNKFSHLLIDLRDAILKDAQETYHTSTHSRGY